MGIKASKEGLKSGKKRDDEDDDWKTWYECQDFEGLPEKGRRQFANYVGQTKGETHLRKLEFWFEFERIGEYEGEWRRKKEVLAAACGGGAAKVVNAPAGRVTDAVKFMDSTVKGFEQFKSFIQEINKDLKIKDLDHCFKEFKVHLKKKYIDN